MARRGDGRSRGANALGPTRRSAPAPLDPKVMAASITTSRPGHYNPSCVFATGAAVVETHLLLYRSAVRRPGARRAVGGGTSTLAGQRIASCRRSRDRVVLARKPDAVLGLATGSSPLAIHDELTNRCADGTVTFARAKVLACRT